MMICSDCNGDGFILDHDDMNTHDPWDGSCRSCPVQAPCESCFITGIVAHPSELSPFDALMDNAQPFEMVGS